MFSRPGSEENNEISHVIGNRIGEEQIKKKQVLFIFQYCI
jgi:hypothetical protein